MSSNFSGFPSQKKAQSQKTKKWYKDCIDAMDTSGFFSDESVRSSFKEKLINSNLYNGILDPADITSVLNPNDISDKTIPNTMQHYPIINPRIDVLVGEEYKRRFDYRAVVTNSEAISEKEIELNGHVKAKIIELLESKYQDEELQSKIEALQQDISSFQDKRESAINKLLKHYWRELKIDKLFNNGFRNSLIQGEEHYEAVINGGKPELWKINPMNLFTVRSGYSKKTQDADLIIISDYWSPGQVIDFYHDELTEKQLRELDRGFGGGDNKSDPFVDKGHLNRMTMSLNMLDSESSPDQVDGLIKLGEQNGFSLNDSFDTSGNIRVLRVYWRGWRKVQKVTYFDEFGKEQMDFFPESYMIKKDEGETSKTIWINEWYEGTKIGNDIYLRLQPKEIQFRSIENPASSHPGIVGKTYSFDNFKTVSLMGKVKNYLYLYDAIHERLNRLLAANQGKILEMDLSTIPDGWDVQKWFHYVNKMKIAVKDSFKEGSKGAATGKLAGSLNSASKGYIDLDQGQNIQQHIGLLEFIKREMTEITGVSEQRMGTISNRETVGGVERSVTQSSHITEWYFSEHEDVKIDALRVFVEVLKLSLKNKNKKFQYILDDSDIATLSVDGEMIQEADYGILVTNSMRSQEAEQNIRRLAESALQAGSAQFEDVVDLYLADSLADVKNNVKSAARQAKMERQKQSEEEQKTLRQQIEQAAADKQQDRELEESLNLRDNQTKIAIALHSSSEDELDKLELDRQKRFDGLVQFNESLSENKRQFDEKMELEDKKLNVSKGNNK
jgi:hypothetical protein